MYPQVDKLLQHSVNSVNKNNTRKQWEACRDLVNQTVPNLPVRLTALIIHGCAFILLFSGCDWLDLRMVSVTAESTFWWNTYWCCLPSWSVSHEALLLFIQYLFTFLLYFILIKYLPSRIVAKALSPRGGSPYAAFGLAHHQVKTNVSLETFESQPSYYYAVTHTQTISGFSYWSMNANIM